MYEKRDNDRRDNGDNGNRGKSFNQSRERANDNRDNDIIFGVRSVIEAVKAGALEGYT